jgi:hypothetical protein
VVISPLAPEEWDEATDSIRALWPGRIRLVRAAAQADTVRGSGLAVSSEPEDPVRVAAALAGRSRPDTTVRITRGAAGAADSAWAAGGRVLVRWPAAGAPPGWTPRDPPDTAGAVIAGSATVVFPVERRHRLDPASAGRVVARWVDGDPAAVEREIGAGCIRDVAIAVPQRGDLVLRPAFARLLDALTAPCGEVGRAGARTAPDLAGFAGAGPLASRASIAAPATVVPPLVPWLLGGALLLAIAELFVRRDDRAKAG